MTIDELLAWRQERIGKEGGRLFMGLPDRWFEEGPRYRCIKGHVSTTVLLSETEGGVCLTCFGAVLLTFPEDTETERTS